MSYGDAAKVDEAFAKAAHTVELDLVSQRLVPSAMEPRSTIAEIDKTTGRLLLHVQSQTPASTRDVLAEAVLKRPKDSVRVLVGDIGGGFGQKTNLYPEDGIVAYAATKLNRKIRWRGDRTDEFVGGTHGRDLTSTGVLRARREGQGAGLSRHARSAAPAPIPRARPTSFRWCSVRSCRPASTICRWCISRSSR